MRRAAARIAVAAMLIGGLLVASSIAQGERHPPFDHVYLIVMSYPGPDPIVGNPRAPYLNSLIHGYGLATNYSAVASASQPNRLTMLTGSTKGVTDDAPHDLTGETLLDQLEARGLSWHVYAQDYPGDCFTGPFGSGGVDLAGAPGTYSRAHNPAISFKSVSGNPKRCANITSLASFDPAAANFEMIVPNTDNSMATGAVGQADGFLRAFVPRILSSPEFTRSILFIAWDRGSTTDPLGGKVPLVVVRSGIKPGLESPTAHSHRGLLRTIQQVWGLPCLSGSCSAAPFTDLVRTS